MLSLILLLYGILLCGLVGGLFGRKLQVNSQNEVLLKRMAIEGVMAIQAQDNPRIVEHKLAVFIQPKDRPSGKNQETVGPVPVKGSYARRARAIYICKARVDPALSARGHRDVRD